MPEHDPILYNNLTDAFLGSPSQTLSICKTFLDGENLKAEKVEGVYKLGNLAILTL